MNMTKRWYNLPLRRCKHLSMSYRSFSIGCMFLLFIRLLSCRRVSLENKIMIKQLYVVKAHLSSVVVRRGLDSSFDQKASFFTYMFTGLSNSWKETYCFQNSRILFFALWLFQRKNRSRGYRFIIVSSLFSQTPPRLTSFDSPLQTFYNWHCYWSKTNSLIQRELAKWYRRNYYYY